MNHDAADAHVPGFATLAVHAGPEPGAVRLSVGIEDAADLIADLDQALAGAA